MDIKLICSLLLFIKVRNTTDAAHLTKTDAVHKGSYTNKLWACLGLIFVILTGRKTKQNKKPVTTQNSSTKTRTNEEQEQ